MATIRPYRACDAPALARILYEQWPYPATGEEAGLLKGRFDLYNELERSSVALVAELDGAPVGIVVARDPFLGDGGFVGADELSRAASELAASDGGLASLRFLSAERQRVAELVGQIEDPFSCEITLLIVGKAAQGLGLGRELLSALTAELAERGVEGVHLYTDDYCDWRFYERQGFTRAIERTWEDAEEGPFRAFIFERALVPGAKEEG